MYDAVYVLLHLLAVLILQVAKTWKKRIKVFVVIPQTEDEM